MNIAEGLYFFLLILVPFPVKFTKLLFFLPSSFCETHSAAYYGFKFQKEINFLAVVATVTLKLIQFKAIACLWERCSASTTITH